MKLGLCLAGGGVKGAAHIGVLKAIEEEKIKINYISGTSSGSIIAALFASGYSYDEILLLFKKYSKKIKYINYANLFKLIFGLIIKRKIIIKGLNNSKIIEQTVNEACAKKGIYNINQINMPLIIPSVDLNKGNMVCFCSKENRSIISDKIEYVNNINIGDAVRASCSYPLVFEPYEYNSTQLIDGGIRENIPWKETKKLRCRKGN